MLISPWLERWTSLLLWQRSPGTRVRSGIRSAARLPMIEVLETRIVLAGDAELVEDAIAGGGINPGSANSNSFFNYLTNVNGTLYFLADDGTNGQELWRINGSGVAEMVEDAVAGGGINPGSATSSPSLLRNVNGTLYFSADDGTNGRELYFTR